MGSRSGTGCFQWTSLFNISCRVPASPHPQAETKKHQKCSDAFWQTNARRGLVWHLLPVPSRGEASSGISCAQGVRDLFVEPHRRKYRNRNVSDASLADIGLTLSVENPRPAAAANMPRSTFHEEPQSHVMYNSEPAPSPPTRLHHRHDIDWRQREWSCLG